MWQTASVIDNKIEKYRTSRPIFVYFAFGYDEPQTKKQVIWISYSNTQFGYLDKSNGKFTFVGQD